MTAQPSRPASKGDTGTPRWVQVFGIMVIVLVLLLVALMLFGVGGGTHGPRRHTSPDNQPSGYGRTRTWETGTVMHRGSPGEGRQVREMAT